MATVRVSDKLKQEVRQMVHTMRQKSIQEIGPEVSARRMYATLSDHERDAVRALLWQGNKHESLRAITPEEWCENVRTVTISGVLNGVETFALYVEEAKGAPPQSETYRRRVDINDEPRFQWVRDWAQKVSDYTIKCKEVQAEYSKIEDQVLTFLGAYPTLNAAVKKWAGIRLYVPKHILDVLDRKVERSSSSKGDEEAHGDIDFAALTVAGTAARMSGG